MCCISGYACSPFAEIFGRICLCRVIKNCWKSTLRPLSHWKVSFASRFRKFITFESDFHKIVTFESDKLSKVDRTHLKVFFLRKKLSSVKGALMWKCLWWWLLHLCDVHCSKLDRKWYRAVMYLVVNSCSWPKVLIILVNSIGSY